MDIGGTNGVNGVRRIYPKLPQTEPVKPAAAKAPAGDQVEISDAARLSEAMARLPDIRADKVARAKAMIADGSLDTPENMDVALGRMIDEMLGQAELE